MKTMYHILQPIASLAVIVFVLQLPVSDLHSFSVAIIEYLHDSVLNIPLRIVTKTISYLVLGCIILVFLVHNFIIKPKFARSMDYIMFLCSAIGLNCFLKVLFGEIRPFMYVLMRKKESENFDCETDFGMPSGHLFLATCVYYMYRIRYFSNRPCPGEDGSALHIDLFDSEIETDFMVPYESKIKQEGPMELSYHSFNLLSGFYLFILAISRYVAGSHFILQVLFGFLFGFLYSYIYFRYFSMFYQKLVYSIYIDPPSRNLTLKAINRLFLTLLLIEAILVVCKMKLNNTKEVGMLEDLLTDACGFGFHLGLKNFHDSLNIFTPLIGLNMINLMDLSKRMPRTSEITYFDLKRTDKIVRFVFFLGPFLVVYLIKWSFDSMVFIITGEKMYSSISIVVQLISCVFMGYYYAILLPLLLYKTGLTLKKELPYAVDDQFFSNGEDHNNIDDQLSESKVINADKDIETPIMAPQENLPDDNITKLGSD